MAQTCANPIPAGVGDTAFATQPGQAVVLTAAECDVSAFGGNVVHNAAWLRFRPVAAGVSYRIETCGLVNFDTRIAVLAPCPSSTCPVTVCGAPRTCIAGNDDGRSADGPCTITSGNPWASRVMTPPATAADVESGWLIAVGSSLSTVQGSGLVRILPQGSSEDGQSCATAFRIAAPAGGSTATVSFSNVSVSQGATVPATCALAPQDDGLVHRAVWFEFVATASQRIEVSTCGGPGFDTRLAVFDSTNGCSAPTFAGCNDDDPSCGDDPFRSTVVIDAQEGHTYSVAVGGHSASAAGIGSLNLTFGVDPPPGCGTVRQSCCEPTKGGAAPHCSDAACCEIICADDPFCCSIDWDATCAGHAQAACAPCREAICSAGTGKFGAALPENEACGTQLNEGCSEFPVLVSPITVGAPVAGSFWAIGPTPEDPFAVRRDQDVYEFTLTETTQVTARLTSDGPGMVLILDRECPGTVLALSDELAPACPAEATACLLPGTYRVLVQMSILAGFPCDDFGPANEYLLSLEGTPCDGEAPANDECSGALPVAQAGDSLPFSTAFATNSQPGLPFECDEGNGVSIVRDIWYAWTPEPGTARVSTCGSGSLLGSFDTRLAAYPLAPGQSCADGLTLAACNDDSRECEFFGSVIVFPADGSTTFLVRVGGFDSAGSGLLSFSVEPPLADDDCDGATLLEFGPPDASGARSTDPVSANTLLATSGGPPLAPTECDGIAGPPVARDRWFRFTAPLSGVVDVSTCGSSGALVFDTLIGIYVGQCGPTAKLVACNDDGDGCDFLTSRVRLDGVEAGTAYLVRVGGVLGDAGDAILQVTCSPAPVVPSNDRCAGAIAIVADAPNGTSEIAFDSTVAADDAPTAPGGGCAGATFLRDVWYLYEPTYGGVTTFSLCNASTDFDTRLEVWDDCPPQQGGAGTLLACNNDGLDPAGCGNRSELAVTLPCGRSYLVRVGGFSRSAASGPGLLRVVAGLIPCSETCRGDLDRNGIVEGGDLGLLISAWGPNHAAPADLDFDGRVDGADLAVLLNEWGPCN